MGRIRKDGGRDRRFKENKNTFDSISSAKSGRRGGGDKEKKGCLKKLGCLTLLLLPLAILGIRK